MTGWILYWTGLVSLTAGAAGWFAWWCNRPLRGATEAAGTRIDWTWIRVMEYEIWGRTFRHEGAPGISGQETVRKAPAQVRQAGNGHIVHAIDAADEESRVTWITEGGVRIAAIVPAELITEADQEES